MKKILFNLLFALLICGATKSQQNPPLTTVKFIEETHDFGIITEGDVVTCTFKFKNTGSNPLKVGNVKPSCGCTIPEWPKEDIAPGAEGWIKIKFDSKGKRGAQRKSVTVTFENTDPKNKILTVKADVRD